MIMTIIELIPVALAAIIMLIALLTIYFRSKNLSRSQFFGIFKTAKYLSSWVIILTILLTGFFGVMNHIKTSRSVHAVIALNYSEASQAHNSNGTRYNMAEIISDEVVARAIEKGALENVSVKDLKKCLTVYPCVQGGSDDPSEYHISTEFTVEYHASKKTRHLDTENVIKLVTAAYKEYYIEKYTDNFSLDSEMTDKDFKNMEYMDIVSYLNKESDSVLSYLYGMAEKAPSFVMENNTTFNSIAGKVYQFKENQIEQNLHSLILQNGIVRNKQEYIDRLKYQNTNTDFDRQKNAVSFDLCNQAIARYSEEMTRIVLVPTWDQTGKYYMGRTKVGVDELSVKATEFSNNVASNEKEIMNNNLVMEKINTASQNPEMDKAADDLVMTIYKGIKGFEREAINAGRQYSNHKMNQCIAVTIYGPSFMSRLKAIALYALFAYVAIMLCVISKKFPKRA